MPTESSTPASEAPRPAEVRASPRARAWRALRIALLLGVIELVLSYTLSLMLFHPSRGEGHDVARIGGERVTYVTRDGVRLVVGSEATEILHDEKESHVVLRGERGTA